MTRAMPQFTKDNQPNPETRKGRGKSERTKILDALKRLGKTEDDFYDLLIGRALDPEDTFALREVLGRFAPIKKAVLPNVEFDFDESGTPVQQVAQILKAVSSGGIAPDVGAMIIGAVKSAIDIEANTELKARIEEIERLLVEAGVERSTQEA